MPRTLQELIEMARQVRMTPEELEEQRVSDSVSEGATISVQWEPPDRLRRESFEGARKEG